MPSVCNFSIPLLTDGSVAQACMNIAACLGAVIGPMAIGALTKRDPVNGWRDFYVCETIPSQNSNTQHFNSITDIKV